MKYLYTKQEHYKKYINQFKTDRIDKGIKIYTESKNSFLSENGIINEIFNEPITTEYELSNVFGSKNHKVVFNTKSGEEYRLDIFPIDEVDKGLVNHLAFSLSENEIGDEYENLTNKKEMIEILNRIHFIILDLVKSREITNYFCIGGTEIKTKNSIYEYFLKIVVGENGFEKLNTGVYRNNGIDWGLYFKI